MVGVDVGGGGCIEVEDVYVVWIFFLKEWGEVVVIYVGFVGEFEGDGDGGDLCGVGGVDYVVGGFVDVEVGVEEVDDV